MRTPVVAWLLDGDPAIRWQVMRDLLDADDDTWRAERARVETHGWGARFLPAEDPEGTWAAGAWTTVAGRRSDSHADQCGSRWNR